MTTVPIAVDTYADQNRQSHSFGNAARLKINGGGVSNDRHVYFHVAPPFPIGSTVAAAILRFYLAEAWGGSQTVTVKRITQGWQESKLNWNNKPNVDPLHAASVNLAGLADGAEAEVDITAIMADVSAGAPYFGLRLELDVNNSRLIYSSEHTIAELRPELDIEWSEAPQAPTNLVPGGGQAVSIAKPILSWTFVDEAGDTTQESSQLQIDDAPDFATPVYDSGQVANNQGSFDLAPTAFAGISAGATMFWRVRTWDGAGLISEWSDPVEFTRVAKGTLTLDNPPAGTPIEETTPPIIWTFTPPAGHVQEAFAVDLYRVEPSGPNTLLWSLARTVSADDSVAIPSGLIRTGDEYRIELRVWDDVDRAATPGDSPFVLATRDPFTYTQAGVASPVTGLSVAVQDAAVVLTWSRATAPDYFGLRVNGIERLDDINPADVLVSGTTYSFTYWGAIPRVLAEYEVEAIVNDLGVLKHSTGNPTVEAITNPKGIWLADVDDSLAVFVAGKEKATMGVGEAGTTYMPIGSRRPVRITDSVRGYEGSFNGILLDKSARDDFLELKGRLKPLRLIIGDLNIPVRLEDVTTIPDPMGDRGYACSFAFFQDGEETFEIVGGQ